MPAAEALAAEPAAEAAAAAEAPKDAPEGEDDGPSLEEERLTGAWGGVRQALLDRGLDLALVYKGELHRNSSGGVKKDQSYLANVDLKLAADGEKLVGWQGGHAFLYVIGDHGGRPSEYVGDANGTSNIEVATDAVKVYEAWLQQDFADGKASVLAGLHDLNSEFYACDSAGLFLNGVFGVGKELAQTGENGPSIFPNTATAVRLRVDPTPTFYTQIALFNGTAGDPEEPKHVLTWRRRTSDGALAIVEAGVRPGNGAKGALATKLAVGGWVYTKPLDRIDGAGADTSSGGYLLADRAVTENVAVFAHYGVASATVNRFVRSVAAGTTLTGLLPTRDKDRLGLGYVESWDGSLYRDAQTAAGETTTPSERVFELIYRIELWHGVALMPDYQYVANPDAHRGDAAHVEMVRLEVAL
jgi:porin